LRGSIVRFVQPSNDIELIGNYCHSYYNSSMNLMNISFIKWFYLLSRLRRVWVQVGLWA
jgi:hypothetical protein